MQKMSVHILNIGIGDPLAIDYQFYFWLLMVLNLLFIGVARTSNQQYISSLFRTALVNRQLMQTTQEELKLGSTSSILLTCTYFFNVAILLNYLVVQNHGISILLFLGILVGAALIKWMAMWSLIFVTENKRGVVEHGMNHLIYFQVGGLILTPILLLSHYLQPDYYEKVVSGLAIFLGLLILFREIQSIARAIKSRVGGLYIILYLCTLELMPLVLIIYAFVVDNAGLN